MTNSNCIQKVWCPICTYSQARCLRAGFSFHKQLHDDITSPLLIQIFLLLLSLFSLSFFKHWQKRWHSLLRFGKQCLHDCCWFVYRDFFYNLLLQVELVEVTRLRSGEVWSKMETLRKLFFPGEAKAWPDDVLLLKQRSAHGIFRNICEDECNSRCDSAIAGCSISQSSVEAFSGGRSLFVEGRTAKWSGPVAGIQSNMWVWKWDVTRLWGHELSESGLDISAIRGASQLELSWAIKASPGFIYQWTIRKDIRNPYFIWIHRPIGRPKLMGKKNLLKSPAAQFILTMVGVTSQQTSLLKLAWRRTQYHWKST